MNQLINVGLQRARWSVILFLLMGMAAAFQVRAADPIIVTDHGTYLTGEAIKVGFTNGPANAKDWIGIYPTGTLPGTGTGSTAYLYVDNTTGGTTGKASGEVTFAAGLPTAGDYTAYLLRNDGYEILAQQDFKVQVATDPQVRMNKRLYGLGEPISVNFSRGPGGEKDWIAIYHKTETVGSGSTAYRYVDNTTTGLVGKTDGTVTFPDGLQFPREFIVYFLPNDDYTPVAQESFTVLPRTAGLVSLETDHDHYLQGQMVYFTFDGGPGNPTDWVGVYRPGNVPGPNPSTDWRYVNNFQAATNGYSSGTVNFGSGLGVGPWVSYFLLEDGYEIASKEVSFQVIDAFAPIIQVSKRQYEPGEAITLAFTNAPANAKDWVAIYKKGETPAAQGANYVVYKYTDGTTSGTAGITEGAISFPAGISEPGDYVAYLFENDGYVPLSSENFRVQATGILLARVVSISPPDAMTNALAQPDFKAILENRDTTVVQNSIVLKLDNVVVPHQVTVDGTRLTVTAQASSTLTEGSQHTYSLTFKDSANNDITGSSTFNVGRVVNITLPTPIFFENFDSTAEGSVPTGWTVSNQSSSQGVDFDLGHLGSTAYANFTVVSTNRLAGDFIAYSDTTPTTAPIDQILGVSKDSYVVNGSFVRTFANNKVLIGISGYHGGNSQILEAITPAINLTGKSDIYVSFHNLLEQYGDSIEGIEVSTDGGTTWAPVAYYLEPADIISTGGTVDVETTYNTTRNDIAMSPEGVGGSYGAFVKAPLDAQVGSRTFARSVSDAPDGTRIELIRVPQADNKADVRFRFFIAGTDSWYFGLDDFGVYSIPTAPALTISKTGGTITITWPAAAGYVLQSSETLTPASWTNVPGVTGNSYSPATLATQGFYRLFKP